MKVRGIDVVNWNPPKTLRREGIGSRIPLGGRIDNFGDLLGPYIADALAPRDGQGDGTRLLAVGSILHLAGTGDHIWGTGVNGKVPESEFVAKRLNIHAVRGPRTAQFLESRGFEVPTVYGDPGLIVPGLLGVGRAARSSHSVTVLPNLRDRRSWRAYSGYLSPTTPLRRVVERLAASDLVVTSSLHGIVISESLGVPVAMVRPGEESLFKYEDYFEGTGRGLAPVHDSVEKALARPMFGDPLRWNDRALIASFPSDLWEVRARP
jgi:pyruvyltransferase